MAIPLRANGGATDSDTSGVPGVLGTLASCLRPVGMSQAVLELSRLLVQRNRPLVRRQLMGFARAARYCAAPLLSLGKEQGKRPACMRVVGPSPVTPSGAGIGPPPPPPPPPPRDADGPA